ncbi:MAG: hypothetical protein JST87_05025 [Bacteroidetes bacterium]|nr:hypothetical protein [Bacteroidota bacterium]
MKMLSGIQNENNLYISKLNVFTAYTSSQSSERPACSIIPVGLLKRKIISWPLMIIAMITLYPDFIPAIILTFGCVLFLFYAGTKRIASANDIAVPSTVINKNKFQTVSRFMPQCICRDFFISTQTTFIVEKQQLVFYETECKKINSCL